MSTDGTIVAIGTIDYAACDEDSGRARVYQWDDGSNEWVQLGEDIEGNSAGDHFGTSLALSSNGMTVAIGASQLDNIFSPPGYVGIYSYM